MGRHPIDDIDNGINMMMIIVQKLKKSFISERFPLPLGTWDGLRYFIWVLPEPSI